MNWPASHKYLALLVLLLSLASALANECRQKPNVCKNGATCMTKVDGYQCICVNGWTGPDCSENVDDCKEAACEAGATCHDRVGHFYCECPPGKTGIFCQLNDGCFHSPCHKNATCDPSPTDGHAICTCPAGYSGADCSIDNDECAIGSPCEHGGVCVNTPGSFRCECPPGFRGSRCEVNINECETNPCQNDGTCLDERGGYKCICAPGFTGLRCEIEIDECAQNPCHNGALCKDLVNSFRCLCQPGFWGQRCEFSVNKTILTTSTAPSAHASNHHHQPQTPPSLGMGNPWIKCSDPLACWTAFKDGKCDQGCNTAECLYDGNDCAPIVYGKHPAPSSSSSSSAPHNSNNAKAICDEKSDSYCLRNYANGVCDQECNTAECGWDGADCELPRGGDTLATNTEAQGLLVITVEPAIEIGNNSNSRWNIELARLLRKIAVMTQTILKIQNFRQLEEEHCTEIELIADNRNCRDSCYNTTELMALFINALQVRTKEFERSMTSGELKMTDIRSQTQPDTTTQNQRSASTLYVIVSGSIAAVCALLMVISIGNKQKAKEKAIVWFPEGFKPVLSSRARDPTNRKPGRGVSTLQALGGNFFRGIKRNERNISTNPNGLNSTDIDRSTTATPNGGGIYHEPYDQYDQYGSYSADSAIVNNVEVPMTPTPMPVNPINLEGPHGLTPLMVASMGAPPSKEPLGLVNYGTTGEMNGSWDNNVTDLLNRGAQLNLANKITGETALHLAARHGRVDAARTILERCDSQDVNAQDASGRTPLHSAIAAYSLGVFELLIRCRATDLNAQTNDGTTPLILATRVNAYSMLEELILKECEVTKSDADGKTALHWAAATGNVDIIRRLLAVRETNKDAQDLAEETPLFLAAREGSKAAVELLLSHNANKDISDQMDRSPIDIARSRNHLDIVRLLEEHEPSTPRSIKSIHHSRQVSPFSPSTDSNGNSNGCNIPPPPSYHTHTQSVPRPTGGRQAQKAVARSNSSSLTHIVCNLTEVYNVPCLKNYMTPSPDSPFGLEWPMTSPLGAYTDHSNGQKQAGVFI